MAIVKRADFQCMMVDEITQGMLEKFEKALHPQIEGVGAIELAVYSGAVLRSAIDAGIIAEVNISDISTLKPWKVTYISGMVAEAIRDSREVPPE